MAVHNNQYTNIPTVDSIIHGGFFIHDDKDVARAFDLNVQAWKETHKGAVIADQIFYGFQALGDKLLEAKCPTYGTAGYKQVTGVFKVLVDLARLQMEMGAIHPTVLHELCYTLMINWLEAGPSTVSYALINDLHTNKFLGMKEYVKNLKGEGLNRLLRVAASPPVKKEDTQDREFYCRFRVGLGMLLKDALDKAQLILEENMNLLLDFAFHLYLDYTHLEDDSVKEMVAGAKDILRMYSEKWKTLSDIPRFKSYIKKFSDLAKTPGFPRNKAIAVLSYDALYQIAKQIKVTGTVEAFASDMFDLMEVMGRAQGDKEHLVKAFSATVVFFDQRNTNKNNPTVFKILAPRFKSLVSTLDSTILIGTTFVSDIMPLLENSYSDNHELTALWISSCLPLVKRQNPKTMKACRAILSKTDKIKWKEHQEFVHEFLKAIKEAEIPSDDSKELCVKAIQESLEYLLRGLKRTRILKTYGKTLMHLSLYFLELKPWNEILISAAKELGDHIEIDVKENKDDVMMVMERLHDILKDETMPWDQSWALHRSVINIIRSISQCVKDAKIFSEKDFKVFTSMCVTCLEKEPIHPDTGHLSHHYEVALKIMSSLIPWLGAVKNVSIAKEVIPLLLRAIDDDETKIHQSVGTPLREFSSQDPKVLAPFFDDFIMIFLDKEVLELLHPISKVYTSTRVSLKNHFQVLFTYMTETDDPRAKGEFSSLFWTASTKEAELFTEDNMKDLIQLAKSNDSQQGMCLQVINSVCKRRPGKLIKHLDSLMRMEEWNPMLLSIINDVLCTIALFDKNVSDKIVNRFIGTAKTESDKGVLLTALNSIKLIGFKYPDVIKPKRQHLEKLQLIDGDALGMRQLILDMIDGKTPEDVKKQLEAQQTAVSDLVERVDEVEVTVDAVVGDVKEQRKDLNNVKNDVTKQSQRLDQVEEVVDDTVKKVEEIDNKTLSHAPYWSRDISKLLNPATKHDWRLLSSRLGYNNADIRGWAQQADPCMAMLNEWYATRKTSEATYAILTSLQEMNREDAALIVENAMKKAEAVVEDEAFEYASPPEIFISYQWGHQEEVKLLHRHLAMAGYDCWMDIGQMGGGDKLFEKIDNGMRAAKLVISCVTTKYAKSPNCNREVTLAVGVKKPIIPLLLENCSWPPPGSMGPIFSESLYIQFFQTGQEETNDDRYWPVDKFQELLMQLSANGLVPNEGNIDKVYRNWWMPLEAEIKIDKSKTRNGGKQVAVAQNDTAESEESPDVFISYQWGKQKNIIKLYQRLTSLGFSCWLDIKQMGGGDSLYDKIDRGIRGSKVVVACVTKKYSLSPNCRREVSLTDALKKPMVPLLLEDMTWPPPGPMSMVMTQLLYIGFQQTSAHTKWEGPQFDELVSKISQHVPNTSSHQFHPPKSKNESSESNEKYRNDQQSSEPKPDTSVNKSVKTDIAANSDEPLPEGEPQPSGNKQTPPQLAKSTDISTLNNKTSPPATNHRKAQPNSDTTLDLPSNKDSNQNMTAAKGKPPPGQDKPPSNNQLSSPQPAPSKYSAPVPLDAPHNEPQKSKSCSII